MEIWGERDFFIISFSTISTYIYYHISCIHITFKNYALQKIKLKTTDKESEKVGLKLNIQKTKIMASISITSWQIEGETMEAVTDFIFLGSKITADGDCSHEIKMLAPWKKSYDQPKQYIKKLRLCQERSI